ncbi:MAG: hypothetical protein IPO27_11090 [Bacteroidetes bacterium]|nr:hypothetical protein [Bacteroidota bacterium]
MKKNTIAAIIIISMFVSLFHSCKKVDKDEIDATICVREYGTSKPLANATIIITRGSPASGVGTGEVERLTTDENGICEYKKKVDGDYFYYAEAKRLVILIIINRIV